MTCEEGWLDFRRGNLSNLLIQNSGLLILIYAGGGALILKKNCKKSLGIAFNLCFD